MPLWRLLPIASAVMAAASYAAPMARSATGGSEPEVRSVPVPAYNDGDTMSLRIGGSVFENNHANEGGGAIFFVSDDRSGTMAIRQSVLEHNRNDGFQTAGLAGIFSWAPGVRPSAAQSCGSPRILG
jgi:predicted outer membrane repeat protein